MDLEVVLLCLIHVFVLRVMWVRDPVSVSSPCHDSPCHVGSRNGSSGQTHSPVLCRERLRNWSVCHGDVTVLRSRSRCVNLCDCELCRAGFSANLRVSSPCHT